jgi:hypothetical protein
MATIEAWAGTYAKNAGKHGQEPCIMCGRALKGAGVRHVIASPALGRLVSRDEVARMSDAERESSEVSVYGIGPECFRKNRAALEPFLPAEGDA